MKAEVTNYILHQQHNSCCCCCWVSLWPRKSVSLPWRVRPCLNVQTESVHKICRQNLSKIKLCDWPNKLDTTSWQVLNTTESVAWTDSNKLFWHLIESVHRYFLSVLRRFCRAIWFDGKKKNKHLLYTRNSTTVKKKKDISCYILEIVQLSCYVLIPE